MMHFLQHLTQELDLINQISYHKDMEKSPAYKMKSEKNVMVTVYRQEIAEWLLMEYHAALHTVREKIRLFEQKYKQSWNEFKEQVEHAEQEDFSRWDDYIEWKSQIKILDELSVKIEEVRHGNFEIA
ncbi:MAG: hypothetical protein D3916_14925 [Candidatus Electrothrix sp. MAN1_4]|nr:hypothetical protein [Candidatus Electrothrix sp. MAN1_4]